MDYRGAKGRKTGAALKEMAGIFGGAGGGDGKQLLFLLITGKSEDDVIGPARNLVQKGISIFAIGIGVSVDTNELKTISRYYLTTKWRGLVTSLVKVQNTVIKGIVLRFTRMFAGLCFCLFIQTADISHICLTIG